MTASIGPVVTRAVRMRVAAHDGPHPAGQAGEHGGDDHERHRDLEHPAEAVLAFDFRRKRAIHGRPMHQAPCRLSAAGTTTYAERIDARRSTSHEAVFRSGQSFPFSALLASGDSDPAVRTATGESADPSENKPQ